MAYKLKNNGLRAIAVRVPGTILTLRPGKTVETEGEPLNLAQLKKLGSVKITEPKAEAEPAASGKAPAPKTPTPPAKPG